MPFLGNITPQEVFEMGLHARPSARFAEVQSIRNLLRAPEVDLVISYYTANRRVKSHDTTAETT